jgi:hypothetical protein
MTTYYRLSPEVAGHWGEHTIKDDSVHPPKVDRLHYEFDGWLGDELLTSIATIIVTDRLRKKIEAATLSGYAFDTVETSVSDQFVELYPGVSLPPFSRLKITGTAGKDDFGMGDDHHLVVSPHALTVLQSCTFKQCEIVPWRPK